jgi:hypothetical protein
MESSLPHSPEIQQMEGYINGGRYVIHTENSWQSIGKRAPALLPRFFGSHNDKSTVLAHRGGKKSPKIGRI